MKKERPQTFTAIEQIHRVDELPEFPVTFDQAFLVGDRPWHLRGNQKTIWRLVCPTVDHRRCGRSIKRRIDLNRVESCGVIAEVVGGLHSFRIERPQPARRRECRSADAKACQVAEILTDYPAVGEIPALEVTGSEEKHSSGRVNRDLTLASRLRISTGNFADRWQ